MSGSRFDFSQALKIPTLFAYFEPGKKYRATTLVASRMRKPIDIYANAFI
jgi:hypothetical protein